MKNIEIILIGILLINIGCQKEKSKIITEFQIPKVINTKEDTTKKKKYFISNKVEEVFTKYAGKYKFSDKIDVNLENQDTSFRSDYVNGLFLSKNYDSIDVNGFEIYVDYQTNIYKKERKDSVNLYCYYPIYLVNSTSKNKLFTAKDDYVYGIQEARDTSDYDKWRPIEGIGFDFCGNGTWAMIVKPKEFVVILMKKYKGEYQTSLRTRFKIGQTIYVSKSYQGYVNNSQFDFSDNSFHKSRLLQTNGNAAKYLFYGAEPNEEKWKVN